MSMLSKEIRIRQRYRTLILQGKLKVSLDAAVRLVGPDCAYRLYALVRIRKKRGKGRSRE